MGRRFKGLTPYTIHFRVKSLLSESLRRRYTITQCLMWIGSLIVITSGFFYLGSWLVVGDNMAKYIRSPPTIIAFVMSGIGLGLMVGAGGYFRCYLRGAIVRHFELAMARRRPGSTDPIETMETMEVDSGIHDVNPKRPITPSNVHLNVCFTEDFEERY